MEPGISAIPKQCYQCGAATELVLTADATEGGWFSCDRCGERIIPKTDVAALILADQERTIRDKLGVDEFLDARRVDNQVADE